MPFPQFNRGSRRPPSGSLKPHHGVQPKRGHTSSDHPLDQQIFDFMIVVDFECTCERDRGAYPNEIIEFPGILVDVKKGFVDRARSFHTYVKPWRNPILSQFCTDLTGITQDKVDAAPPITEALRLFVEWYKATIPVGAKVVFGTDGPWDFKNFLFNQAVLRDHVSVPTIFYEYIDIRTTFARVFNKGDPIKLDAMLKKLKLRFEGSPHCGFDDAYNIARLAVEMMKKGCIFQFLICIPLDEEEFHTSLEHIPVYRRDEGTGFVTRDHVEEVAKKCFGKAYFDFAKNHLSEVVAHREAELKAKIEAAGPGINKQTKSIRRSDGGMTEWQSQRKLIVWCLSALVAGIVLAIVGAKLNE